MKQTEEIELKREKHFCYILEHSQLRKQKIFNWIAATTILCNFVFETQSI